MSNLNSQIVGIINNFLEEYKLVDARTCKDEFLGMHSSLTVGGANEVVKEIEKVVAQQVKEARIDELNRISADPGEVIPYKHDSFAMGMNFYQSRIADRLAALKGDDK